MYPRREQPYPIPPALSQNHDGTQQPNLNHNQTMMQLPPQSAPQPPPQQQNPANSLRGFSGKKGDRLYTLRVEQQPIRARMCGFGDKDRRPITPPPCIRLIVTDANTGNEIDFNSVDSSFFVLTVDLWSADGAHEVNLVRHSTGAPTVSISTSTTTSYPPPPDRPNLMFPPPPHMSMPPQYHNPYGPPGSVQSQPPVQSYQGAPPPAPPSYYSQSPGTPVTPSYPPYSTTPGGTPHYPPVTPVPVSSPSTATTGMFTRNLIGSLSVNAFRLNDTEGKIGFWFVLQDLSVRTEGSFRLKMNFVDVGSGQGNNSLNTGKAPVSRHNILRGFPSLFGQKVSWCHRKHSIEQSLCESRDKNPDKKRRP